MTNEALRQTIAETYIANDPVALSGVLTSRMAREFNAGRIVRARWRRPASSSSVRPQIAVASAFGARHNDLGNLK
jgi:hypothetical protein